MKNKFFIHPLTEIAATPRGYGKDEYMAIFIKETILKLQQSEENSDAGGLQELVYAVNLKHALEWLYEYYQGRAASEEDYCIYSYYAWSHLKKLDEDLKHY